MTEDPPVGAIPVKSPVIRWLMTEGRHVTDAKSFLESFAARLRDAGVDVSRITTGVPVLHPQLFSVSSLWERDKGVTARRYRVDPSQDAILANSPIRSGVFLTTWSREPSNGSGAARRAADIVERTSK